LSVRRRGLGQRAGQNFFDEAANIARPAPSLCLTEQSITPPLLFR
jgi:hypothetical protein